jgi:hypothetical protein
VAQILVNRAPHLAPAFLLWMIVDNRTPLAQTSFMFARLRSPLLLVWLLLVLPLYAIGNVTSSWVCSPVEHQHEHTIGSTDHDHGAVHEHSAPGDSDSTHLSHAACHHFSVAAPAADPTPVIAAPLPVYSSSLRALATLFIPEQPQRPPRV